MKKQYSVDIQDIIHKIEETDSNSEQALTLGKRLLRMGKSLQDDYLCGLAYFTMQTYYYRHGLINEVLQNHTKALHYLTLSHQYERIVRSYINLGQIAAVQGNTALAIGSYLSAMEIAKKHRMTFSEGILYKNIGELYKNLNEYATALRYFHRAEQYCRKDSSSHYYQINLLLIHASACYCAYKSKDTAYTRQLLTCLDETEPLAENALFNVVLLCVRYLSYFWLGETEQAQSLLPKLITELENTSIIYELYIYFFDICELLIQTNQDDVLIQMIHIMETKLCDAQRNASPLLLIRLLNYKVIYYKRQQNNKHYLRALEQYYHFRERQLTLMQSFSHSIIDFHVRASELAEEQDTMRQEMVALQQKSEKDPLTGLLNYSYIKRLLGHLFENALEKQHSLGVAILDVDFFKQYNDCYGHQAGDNALTTVAGILHSVESPNIFCARYGGDEFIMLFSDMTDGDILKVCQKIKFTLRNKQIPHKGSLSSEYLSVSQGVQNSIPTPGQKPWDYLFSADMALYDMKENAREGIQLVHQSSFPENKTFMRTATADATSQ